MSGNLMSLAEVEREIIGIKKSVNKRLEIAKQCVRVMRENEHYRQALEYISFCSNVVPSVIDGKEMSEEIQNIVNLHRRDLGKIAEEVLSDKDSAHPSNPS